MSNVYDFNTVSVSATDAVSSYAHIATTAQPHHSRAVDLTGSFEVCSNPNISTVDMIANKAEPRDVESFLNALHTIIPVPSDFSPEFRNPCWYMHIAEPSRLAMILKTAVNFTDKQAASVLSYALSFSSSRQRIVCLPKIHLIGFPKSGSTQLYEMLVKHRNIVPGLRKEVHWWTRYPFNARFPHNLLAVLKYLMYFSSASKFISTHPQVLTIDGSQSTMWDTRKLDNPCIMPFLVSSVVSNAKYVVIMREPAERLYSDFLYLSRLRLNRTANAATLINKSQLYTDIPKVFHQTVLLKLKEFHTCLRKYPLEVCAEVALSGTNVIGTVQVLRLGISLYYVHVAKWLRFVPRQQMLFLRTEDLKKCPYSLLQRVWRFLEVPIQSPYELADVLFGHANSNKDTFTKGIEMLRETRTILREFFQPFNKQLAKVLGDRRFLWDDV